MTSMTPQRRQNRDGHSLEGLPLQVSFSFKLVIQSLSITLVIKLLVRVEQCLPAASTKMEGYLQEPDAQLLSATVQMF